MNAPVHDIPKDLSLCAWNNAERAFHSWRGEAVQCFAKGEKLVSEALLLLSEAAPARATNIKLRQLPGQRFEELAAAIGEGGAFVREGRKAAKPLENFRRHKNLRDALCHGEAEVLLDRSGKWTILLRNHVFKEEKSTLALRSVTEKEAFALLDEIRSDLKTLASGLQSLGTLVSNAMKGSG